VGLIRCEGLDSCDKTEWGVCVRFLSLTLQKRVFIHPFVNLYVSNDTKMTNGFLPSKTFPQRADMAAAAFLCFPNRIDQPFYLALPLPIPCNSLDQTITRNQWRARVWRTAGLRSSLAGTGERFSAKLGPGWRAAISSPRQLRREPQMAGDV